MQSGDQLQRHRSAAGRSEIDEMHRERQHALLRAENVQQAGPVSMDDRKIQMVDGVDFEVNAVSVGKAA